MRQLLGLKCWIVCILSLFLQSPQLSAKSPRDNETFFVRLMVDKGRVVEGDSCLLSVVAYATRPFAVTKVPVLGKVKHIRLRALPIGQQPLQRIAEGRQVYFAQVLQQYVLTAKVAGKVKFPEHTYEATLHIEERSNDPFDVFFGRPGRVIKVEKKGKNEPFEMEVVEKPKRTMMEMRQSGLQVL